MTLLPQDFSRLEHLAGRRLLVAAGTANYPSLPGSDLPQVPGEIKQIVDALLPFHYSQCLTELAHNPHSTQLRDRITRWLQEEVHEGDLVVLYYSGHGVREGDSFYLLTHDSEERLLDSTAVSADQLARWMTKHVRASQVLVILDACYSGAGAADFTHVAGKICNLIPQGPAVAVIAAARSKEEAHQGAFSKALRRALKNVDGQLGGATQKFLAFDEVMEGIDQSLAQQRSGQTATWSSVNARGRFRFFPNPRFTPEVSAGWDLELQTTLKEHWVPKAMSAESSGRAWYFTGRTAALRDIVAWLNDSNPASRICVVTGGAGSGKSAVLARLVTLADHNYRVSALSPRTLASLPPDTIPREGCIHVAVHARRKLLADVLRSMRQLLNLESEKCEEARQLTEALAQRRGQTVIVIDALDEATERDAIISQILLPLASLPNTKLIIGTRPDTAEGSPRFRGLGGSTKEVDLDRERYYDPYDIATYVERRLLATEEPSKVTPYQGQPEATKAVARAIADRAGHVFLVARTAVQWLLAQPDCIDTLKPGWADILPSGIQEAFEQFLSGFEGQNGWSAEKAKAVLRPLALAEGEGLPWANVWSQVANALSDRCLKDEDIVYMRDRAAAFIVEAVEDGRSVYRLYHEKLAELLRGEVRDRVVVHRRMAEAISQLVPKRVGSEEPDWSKAQPYILTHLAAHAQAGGILGLFCQDPAFVVHADPYRLLAVLQRSKDPELQRLREVYLLTVNRLLRSTPEMRAAYLGLVAHQQNEPELADRLAQPNLVGFWSSCWAQGAAVTPHRVLATLPEAVTALAFGELEGCPIVVAGSENGNLYCWEGETGIPKGAPWGGHTKEIRALALGKVEGHSAVVSWSEDGTVHCWELATRQPMSELRVENSAGLHDEVVAVGVMGGLPVVVVRSPDGKLNRRHLATDHPLGEALTTGNAFAVRALAVGVVEGRQVVVCSNYDRTLSRWDLETGEPMGETFAVGHEIYGLTALVVGMVNDRSVVICAGKDGMLSRWDLATGQPMGEPFAGSEILPVTVLTIGMVNDRSVVVSGCADSTVQCWDLATGAPMGAPLIGDNLVVMALALGKVEGRSIVVSGSTDGTVRCWELATSQPMNKPIPTRKNWVSSVAVGLVDGRPTVVSATRKSMSWWDLATGRPMGQLGNVYTYGYNYGMEMPAVAIGVINSRSVLVVRNGDGSLIRWDLATGKPMGKPFAGSLGDSVTALAVGILEGCQVVVCSNYDGTLSQWDLATGKRMGKPFAIGVSDSVSALAVGMVEGRQVLVCSKRDGTLSRWDLATGKRMGKPFVEGVGDSVNALALFTLNGRPMVVSGSSNDCTLFFWDLLLGELIFVLDLGVGVNALSSYTDSFIVLGTTRGLLVLRLHPERVRTLLDH